MKYFLLISLIAVYLIMAGCANTEETAAISAKAHCAGYDYGFGKYICDRTVHRQGCVDRHYDITCYKKEKFIQLDKHLQLTK